MSQAQQKYDVSKEALTEALAELEEVYEKVDGYKQRIIELEPKAEALTESESELKKVRGELTVALAEA